MITNVNLPLGTTLPSLLLDSRCLVFSFFFPQLLAIAQPSLKEEDVERPVHGPALHNTVVTSGGHPGIFQFLTKLSKNHRSTRAPVLGGQVTETGSVSYTFCNFKLYSDIGFHAVSCF